MDELTLLQLQKSSLEKADKHLIAAQAERDALDRFTETFKGVDMPFEVAQFLVGCLKYSYENYGLNSKYGNTSIRKLKKDVKRKFGAESGITEVDLDKVDEQHTRRAVQEYDNLFSGTSFTPDVKREILKILTLYYQNVSDREEILASRTSLLDILDQKPESN